MDYRTNNRPASKSRGSFALLVIVGGLLLPSALPAQMVIRLSVYNQVWTGTNGTTVFGSTTTADNSTLGTSCGHSDYMTSSEIITPDGKQYLSGSEGGFGASVNGPFTVDGDYYEQGFLNLHCSCAGNISAGQTEESCLVSALHGGQVSGCPNPHAAAQSGSKSKTAPMVLVAVSTIKVPLASGGSRPNHP